MRRLVVLARGTRGGRPRDLSPEIAGAGTTAGGCARSCGGTRRSCCAARSSGTAASRPGRRPSWASRGRRSCAKIRRLGPALRAALRRGRSRDAILARPATACAGPPAASDGSPREEAGTGGERARGRRADETVGTWASLRSVTRSWRLASVALLSFSSGLPLGLVWIAIPTWMARAGVDIKVIGLFTLAQAPWSFKLLWSPSMDRYRPPFLGRKRGWILVGQVALFALTLWLAQVSDRPPDVWVIGALAFAIAFASATQDIAIDAYAVEVLDREEQGIATGARTALYRAGDAGGRRADRSRWPRRRRGASSTCCWRFSTCP